LDRGDKRWGDRCPAEVFELGFGAKESGLAPILGDFWPSVSPFIIGIRLKMTKNIVLGHKNTYLDGGVWPPWM
jgi:hypothetical protein